MNRPELNAVTKVGLLQLLLSKSTKSGGKPPFPTAVCSQLNLFKLNLTSYATIMVPVPLSVKISVSSAFREVPLRMWAL
jgi:hypothetical protein